MSESKSEENENAFGGGYMKEMTKEEYGIFLKAEDEKDIDIFIDYFIECLEEPNKENENKQEKEEVKPKEDRKEENKA